MLHHLEAQLINVACDDPGAAIGAQLALPLLQERLDAKAQEYARQQAAQAEQDIIQMEVSSLCGSRMAPHLWPFLAVVESKLHVLPFDSVHCQMSFNVAEYHTAVS